MLSGTFILKPDFFENILYLDHMLQLLSQNNCTISQCYVIKEYNNINLKYRTLDLKKRFKKQDEFDKNFSRTQIAYDAYKLSKYNNIGICIIIQSQQEISAKDFYKKLQNIKNDLRDYISKSRNFVYLLIRQKDDIKLLTANESEFEDLKKLYQKNIKLAFINGIHLEDFKLFKSKFCYKTFKKLGIINSHTTIDSNDLPLLFNNFNTEIDLHIHSNCSDGNLSIEELDSKCKALNIKMAAICDHDTININKLKDFNFIYGIELNSNVNQKKCHLLCYNMDVTNKYFSKILEIQNQNRINQLHSRLKQLKETYNITFNEEDVSNIIANEQFSREHLAKLMVKYEYCDTVNSALKNHLNKLKHGNFLINVKKLVGLIHKSGGFIVWAHPLGNYKKRISFETFVKQNDKFLHLVDGIECFYSDYTNEEIKELFKLAQKHNLICTCGSDYHGTRQIEECLGKICKEEIDFENRCNYLIAKNKLSNILLGDRND